VQKNKADVGCLINGGQYPCAHQYLRDTGYGRETDFHQLRRRSKNRKAFFKGVFNV